MEKSLKLIGEITEIKQVGTSTLIKTQQEQFWWNTKKYGEFPAEIGKFYEFELILTGQSYQLEGGQKINSLGFKPEKIKCAKCSREKENLECFISLACAKCETNFSTHTLYFCEECFGKCRVCSRPLNQNWII